MGDARGRGREEPAHHPNTCIDVDYLWVMYASPEMQLRVVSTRHQVWTTGEPDPSEHWFQWNAVETTPTAKTK